VCCQITYCRDCITQWLSTHDNCPGLLHALTINQLVTPPMIVINLWRNMQIKCPFYDDGCGQVIRLGDFYAHLDTCLLNPVCDVCGDRVGVDHNCTDNLRHRVQFLGQRLINLENELNLIKQNTIPKLTNTEGIVALSY
ncbi:unnamed protein product, partial [Oppiella nova]